MPAGGAEARGEQLAALEGAVHDRLTAPAVGEALARLQDELPADADQAAAVRVLARDHAQAAAVPGDLVRALARAGSEGQQAWKAAREEGRFERFAPALARMLELRRRAGRRAAPGAGGGAGPGGRRRPAGAVRRPARRQRAGHAGGAARADARPAAGLAGAAARPGDCPAAARRRLPARPLRRRGPVALHPGAAGANGVRRQGRPPGPLHPPLHHRRHPRRRAGHHPHPRGAAALLGLLLPARGRPRPLRAAAPGRAPPDGALRRRLHGAARVPVAALGEPGRPLAALLARGAAAGVARTSRSWPASPRSASSGR